MPDLLTGSGGGGGGGSGFAVFSPGTTYAKGSLVSRGGCLWGANITTSQDPCLVDGDVGSSTDWQFNLGAGAGLGQTAGVGVLLVNNVNATNSNCISKTVRSGWNGQRFCVDALLNGQADGMYFGVLDGSLPATTAGNLVSTASSGFYGVFLDKFNGLLKVSVNGVVSGTTVSYTNVSSAIAGYDRWYLDLVDAGATMTVILRRCIVSSTARVSGLLATEIEVIATWTGLAKPSFTNYRFALGAYTGGFNMKVHVRTGGTCIMPTTSDWTYICNLPRFN